MNYRLLIRKQAKADLQWASRWYERQSPGLGQIFVAEIDATLTRIEDNPLQYQTIYQDVRRAVSRKFPYGVFYRIVRNDIIVFAIVHLQRDPTSWQNRQ